MSLPFKLDTRTRDRVRKVLGALRKASRILAVSHIRADGDGLGCALTFAKLARKLRKKADVAAEHGAVPEYAFMPGADAVIETVGGLAKRYDAVFSFDCANLGRLGVIGEAVQGVPLVNVDHHKTNTRFGKVNWVDTSFAATTEMVYLLVKLSKVRMDREMAENLYTGLVTDTGGFSFSNTTVRSHRIAADLVSLGVSPEKITGLLYRQKTPEQIRLFGKVIDAMQIAEGGRLAWVTMTNRMKEEAGYHPVETAEYVHFIKTIKGIQCAILLQELPDDDRIRISFRSNAPVDASELAAKFGGGGHAKAAGAMIQGGPDEVTGKVIEGAKEYLRERNRA